MLCLAQFPCWVGPFAFPRHLLLRRSKPGHLPATGALNHGVRRPALRGTACVRAAMRPQVLDLPGHAAYVAEATRAEFISKHQIYVVAMDMTMGMIIDY